MGFFFCICPDGKLIQEQLASYIAQNSPQAKRMVYWGDEDLTASFWENLSLISLNPEPKVLVVRNAHNLDALTWKKISQTLAKPLTNLVILCLEGAWEKEQAKLPAYVSKLACLSFADQQGWVWRSPGLTIANQKAYLKQKIQERNLKLDGAALTALPSLLPLDAASLEAELDKLQLYSFGQPLSLAQVEEVLLDQSVEFNMFALIKTLQTGKNPWLIILEEQKKGEDQLFYLLVMLEREARQLWQILIGEKVWIPVQDKQLKTNLANNLGRNGVAKFFGLLVTAELAVKSGQYSTLQALDQLIANLTLLFKIKI